MRHGEPFSLPSTENASSIQTMKKDGGTTQIALIPTRSFVPTLSTHAPIFHYCTGVCAILMDSVAKWTIALAQDATLARRVPLGQYVSQSVENTETAQTATRAHALAHTMEALAPSTLQTQWVIPQETKSPLTIACPGRQYLMKK